MGGGAEQVGGQLGEAGRARGVGRARAMCGTVPPSVRWFPTDTKFFQPFYVGGDTTENHDFQRGTQRLQGYQKVSA